MVCALTYSLVSRSKKAKLNCTFLFRGTTDTFSTLRTVASETAPTGENYTFQDTGIAWSSDKGKYGKYGYTDLSTVYIPENWRKRYPGPPYTYSADFPPPNVETDEHFQVWMRTAGWPTFLKPYGRNDQTVFKAGQYRMDIDMSKSSCLLQSLIVYPGY